MTRFCIFCSRWSPAAEKSLWGAHAPHVLANAPARWRTCSTCFSLNSQPSTINFLQRGHSSVGRAPALQAGSQGFESPCLQSLKGVEAKSNKKGNIVGCTSGSVIPLPPVYARSVVESVDCRAVALAEADIFRLATSTRRATTRQANLEHGQVFLCLHPSFKVNSTLRDFIRT
jgi:hypothetical protein